MIKKKKKEGKVRKNAKASESKENTSSRIKEDGGGVQNVGDFFFSSSF